MPQHGEYTAGWIKRGPSGVIGTNKKCAADTVEQLLHDLTTGHLNEPADPSREAIDAVLAERAPQAVDWAGWQAIDAAEVAAGEPQGRPASSSSRTSRSPRPPPERRPPSAPPAPQRRAEPWVGWRACPRRAAVDCPRAHACAGAARRAAGGHEPLRRLDGRCTAGAVRRLGWQQLPRDCGGVPRLPADGAGLVHHHAQRFPVAWTVGAVADASGLGVDAAFRVVVAAALLIALALLARALAALQVAPLWRLLLLALFILAPLSTRFYVAFPWIAPDAVFLVGAALVAWGLATDRARLLLGGILVAAVARQTGLLLVPALAAWAALASWPRSTEARAGSRDREAGRRWLVAGVGAAIAVGAYLITDRASTPFSAASMNADTVTGLFAWLGDQPSLGGLASFLSAACSRSRCRPCSWRGCYVAPLRGSLAGRATPRCGWPRRPPAGAGRPGDHRQQPRTPGAAGPPVPAGRDGRADGRSGGAPAGAAPRAGVALLGALAAGSLHHITSLVGRDDSAWAPAFAALTLLCDAVIVWCSGGRRARGPLGLAPPQPRRNAPHTPGAIAWLALSEDAVSHEGSPWRRSRFRTRSLNSTATR